MGKKGAIRFIPRLCHIKADENRQTASVLDSFT